MHSGDSRRPPSPVRSMLFFSILMLSLGSVGTVLHRTLRLGGSMATELSLFLGLATLFWVAVDRKPAAALLRVRPLSRGQAFRLLLLGLVTWGFAQALGMVLLMLIRRLGGQFPEQYGQLTSAPFGVALVVGAVFPALCEEIAFRGYVLRNLEPLGPRLAVLVSGTLFGMMHLSLIRLLPLAILGIVFASAVRRTGSLLAGMILHFVNNATALSLAFWLGSGSNPGLPDTRTALLTLVPLAILLGWAIRQLLTGLGVLNRIPGATEPSAPTQAHAAGGNGSWVRPALCFVPAGLLYILAAIEEVRVVFHLGQ